MINYFLGFYLVALLGLDYWLIDLLSLGLDNCFLGDIYLAELVWFIWLSKGDLILDIDLVYLLILIFLFLGIYKTFLVYLVCLGGEFSLVLLLVLLIGELLGLLLILL